MVLTLKYKEWKIRIDLGLLNGKILTFFLIRISCDENKFITSNCTKIFVQDLYYLYYRWDVTWSLSRAVVLVSSPWRQHFSSLLSCLWPKARGLLSQTFPTPGL